MKSLPSVEERIRDHYINGTELSKEDIRIKERLQTAHSLILSDYENDRNVCSILMERFSISQRQAYIDILNAKNLFGELRNPSKDALRYIVTQMAMDMAKIAKKTGNLKALEKSIERITKANMLDKEDPDMPDASKIQPPMQLITIDFDFIKNPMFKLIDETTQKQILEMYHDFMLQLKLSPLAEYSDMFRIEDIAHTEVD